MTTRAEAQEAALHDEFRSIFEKLRFMQMEHDTQVLAAALLGFSANLFSFMFTAGMNTKEDLALLFAEALQDASTIQEKKPQIAMIDDDGRKVTKQ